LLFFYSYRKPREYADVQVKESQHTISSDVKADENGKPQVAKFTLIMAAVAVVATLSVQVISESMILAGLLVLRS
jgi:Predicted permease